MEDKTSNHKKEKLISENSLEKIPIDPEQSNARDGAAVFQVYNPKTNSYETKSFIKKKKKSNKE